MKTTLLSMAVGVALLFTGSACQNNDATAETRMMEPTGMEFGEVRPLYRASDLMNVTVRNADRTLEGTVQDLILDSDRQHIAELAVNFTDVRDIGMTRWPNERTFAQGERICRVPFKGLRVTAGDTPMAVLPLTDPEQFPCFAANQWPERLHARRFTTLRGRPVHGPDDERLAEVRDLLFDTEDRRITEVTVRTGQRLASVPWNAVELSRDGERIAIDLTSNELNRLAYSEREYWERLGFAGERTERPTQYRHEPKTDTETETHREGEQYRPQKQKHDTKGDDHYQMKEEQPYEHHME